MNRYPKIRRSPPAAGAAKPPPEPAGPAPAREPPPGPAPKQKPQAPPPLWQDLLELAVKLAVLAGAFLLLSAFVFGLYRSQDGDMFPAVKDGDLVVFYRLDTDYAASDCLVLDYQGRRQVRRVIAVAGDTVDITEEGLYLNGVLQYEPNIYESTFRYEEGPDFPLTLGDGEVFVLGDARDNATDSRVYGPVSTADTLGKVMMIIRRREF